MNDATVYRASGGWRLFLIGGGGLLALGGIAGMVYFGRGNEVSGPGDMLMMVGLSAALALLGAYAVASVLHDRLVIAADYIEHRELARIRRMRFADIGGFKVVNADGVDILKLLPRAGAGKGMDITLTYALDDRFRRWLDTLADADARETAAALEEVGRDTLLGYSQVEREQRLEQARHVAGGVNALALGIAAWAIVYPVPYDAALLAAAALPWVAVTLAWTNPAFTLRDSSPDNVHASLFFVVLLPGLALMLRALLDVQLVDAMPVVVAAVAGGALLALLCGAHRKSAAAFALYTAMLATYPGGALPLANSVLDRGAPQHTEVVVQSKRVSSGQVATYYVEVMPVAPDGSDELTVPEGLYRELEPGARACITTRPGALKMAWFELERAGPCAASATVAGPRAAP